MSDETARGRDQVNRAIRVVVDGREVVIQERLDESGVDECTFADDSHGFTVVKSDRAALERAELEEPVKGFLDGLAHGD